jgi:hypothetical protein
MTNIYYKLQNAISSSSPSSYIVAWNNKNNYRFVLFNDFDDFLVKKNNYDSLHEIIIFPNNHTSFNTYFSNRKDGRLCFDFDLDFEKIDNNFNVNVFVKDIEDTINNICEEIYDDIDIKKLIYVWSTSNNPKKLSKHLTINGIFYEDWIPMSQQFYHYFIKRWNEKYNYLNASDFLDKQIVRKNGSLRFVGSTKPDGSSILCLDKSNHTFEMSIVRPRYTWNTTDEQVISYYNLKIPCNIQTINKTDIPIINKHNIDDYLKIHDVSCLDVFEFRNESLVDGVTIYNYKRKQSSFCKICKRVHDNDNAYIKIINNKITFHCYRNNDFYLHINSNMFNKNIFSLTNITTFNQQSEHQQLTITI